MSSLYAKGKRLYFRLKDEDGKWCSERSDFVVGQERSAQAALDKYDARIAAGEEAMGGELGPLTVARWSRVWLVERERQISTWKNDDGVMRLHVLPALGALRLDEVRPRHLVHLVKAWRERTGGAQMAPKSIYNAYSTLSAFFRDAVLEELIATSPCILTKRQLGPKVDKNPEWRAKAYYTAPELETLISERHVTFDRRVFYAIQCIGGLRHGEAAGLRWRNVNREPGTPPLGLLYVAYSYGKPYAKGDVCRPVPIHPTLAGMLAEWKLSGWAELMGRAPTDDDLVVPRPPSSISKHGQYRQKGDSRQWLQKDLAMLGMRPRRGHDLRHSMISLSRSHGANKDILKRVTHKPPKEVIEGYTHFEWEVVCAEVMKLCIQRKADGRVLEMPRARAVGGEELATDLVTVSANHQETVDVYERRHPDSNRGATPGTGVLYTEQAEPCDQLSMGWVGSSPPTVPNQAGLETGGGSKVASAELVAELERIAAQLRAGGDVEVALVDIRRLVEATR